MSTPKFRSYSSWQQQADDEFSEWFWGIVGGFVGIGILVSLPMFAVGAMSAPEGVSRWKTGTEYTVAGHAFVWEKVIVAGAAVANVVGDIMDNGSSEGTAE